MRNYTPVKAADQKTRRTCFVVGPAGGELTSLEAVLAERKVGLLKSERLESGGQSLAALVTQMKKADFVCIVFPKSEILANVMFEAGVAVGLGKPALAISFGRMVLPFDLVSTSVVRLEGSDPNVLEMHLDAFLMTLPQLKRSRRPSKQAPAGGKDLIFDWARKQLEAMSSARASFAGSEAQAAKAIQLEFEFEAFIAELFRRAGYAVTTSPFKDYGVDVVVSSPKVKHGLGGPILIQVKTGFPSRQKAIRERQRLSKLIQNGRGSAGLLVTLEQNSVNEEVLAQRPIILRVPAQRLVSLIEDGELLDVVVAARDQMLSAEQ